MLEYLGAITLLVFIAWLWYSAGRHAERRRAAPWIALANPIFGALQDDAVETVEVHIQRAPNGRDWNANRTVTYKEAR